MSNEKAAQPGVDRFAHPCLAATPRIIPETSHRHWLSLLCASLFRTATHTQALCWTNTRSRGIIPPAGAVATENLKQENNAPFYAMQIDAGCEVKINESHHAVAHREDRFSVKLTDKRNASPFTGTDRATAPLRATRLVRDGSSRTADSLQILVTLLRIGSATGMARFRQRHRFRRGRVQVDLSTQLRDPRQQRCIITDLVRCGYRYRH